MLVGNDLLQLLPGIKQPGLNGTCRYIQQFTDFLQNQILQVKHMQYNSPDW